MLELPHYTIMIIPISLLVISQTLKGIFQYKRGNRSPRAFFMNGGFPSSHTTVVTSLITMVGYVDGLSSTTFAISLVLAIIIIHDAIGIRVHIGKNGKAVNAILNKLEQQTEFKELKQVPRSLEITGHHLHEVLGGIIIGIGGTIIILALLALVL